MYNRFAYFFWICIFFILCFLGITCRLDVIELLEKRVKSRFSHRQIFLFPGPEIVSKTTDLEHAISHINYYLKIDNSTNSKILTKMKKEWNLNLDALLENKKFRNIIERLVDVDNSEAALKNLLVS